MKHITLFTLSIVAAVSLHGQVVFTSGLEDWTGSVPDDWVGSKTNIAASAVTQVSTDPHSGMYAVRLENATTSHKRFTTQPVSVTNGTSYEISFWVRGEGEIRVGLFDGRPGGTSGYAPYNPSNYVSISGNTWQEVSLTMTAAYDTTGGEFILSLRNTVAPEHLVIDDVNIEIAIIEPPAEASIHDIQDTTLPNGDSPLLGETVLTGGVVTAVASNGFFLQNGGGPWSGIFVFSTLNVPARGDSVTFSGTVTEFFGMTQLESVNDFSIVSSGNPLVVTTITALMANSEMYEAVLSEVMAATCTNVDIGNNQWLVNDGTADLSVDELLHTYDPTLSAVYNITGPIRYSFNTYRIVPRDGDDISLVTGIQDVAQFGNVRVAPNPASDLVNLELGSINGRTELIVSDITGRTVITDVLSATRSAVDLSGLSNGTYVFTLRSGSASWSSRVVVQH